MVLGGNVSDSGEKFVRVIEILGTRVKSLIDMGASLCTMKETTTLMLGQPMERRTLTLDGFGDNIVESTGLVYCDLKFDKLKPKAIVFRVVPDTAQRYDVILGRPFSEALDITY